MRNKSMLANKSKWTKPEVALLRALIEGGHEFVDHPRMTGNPDFYVPRHKAAIFVNGCFWHGCERHYRKPKTNAKFWRDKISNNVIRQRRAIKELRREGINPVVIWEHDILTS